MDAISFGHFPQLVRMMNRQYSLFELAFISTWVLPSCVVMERLMMRIVLNEHTFIPFIHPLTLVVGSGLGIYLWFRAFANCRDEHDAKRPKRYAVLLLPLWYVVSGAIAIPFVLLF